MCSCVDQAMGLLETARFLDILPMGDPVDPSSTMSISDIERGVKLVANSTLLRQVRQCRIPVAAVPHFESLPGFSLQRQDLWACWYI